MRSRAPWILLVLSLVSSSLTGCDETPRPFLEARAAFHTTLVRRGATGQPGESPSGPHITRVPYRSGALELHAFLVRPRSHELERSGRAPLLVYYHGGFALDGTDVAAVAPFVEAGFAVLLPALRAENGNPGDFEMFFGELDDARAALEAARTLRGIDPDRIVIFGHSAGAILTALLSMSPDLGVVAAGGAGGLYDTDSFDSPPVPLPYRDTPEERRLRVPVPHIEQLRTPHWACIGEGDWIVDGARRAEARAVAAGAPLELVVLPGDHQASLTPCMRSYLSHVRPLIDAVPARQLPPEAAPSQAPIAAVRVINTSGAFDLVSRAGGALLVWTAPSIGAIRVESLAADGSSAGPSTLLATVEGHVREIEAAVAGEQLAVAWSLTDGHTTTQRAFAAVGPLTGPLGEPTALGEVDPAALQTTRGNLAIAADGEGFVAAVRGAGRCAPGAGCAQVVITGVGGRVARRTVPVEHACARTLVGAIGSQGHAVLGVCDGTSLVRVAIRDGAPEVTRDSAPCGELALLDAGGERRIARCPSPRLVAGAEDLSPSCTEGGLALGTGIALRQAGSGLAPMLPETLASAGSRATWTGEALLIAAPASGELLLRRQSCQDGALASVP